MVVLERCIILAVKLMSKLKMKNPKIPARRTTRSGITARLMLLRIKGAKIAAHGFRNRTVHCDIISINLNALNTLCNRVFGSGNYNIREKDAKTYRVYYTVKGAEK